MKSGRIRPGSYLLVEDLDRISRQGVDVGMDVIKELLRANVFIVTLTNGRVYDKGCLKGLMKGLLDLQIRLEQAEEYSAKLSKRVAVSWEVRRQRARDKGALPTSQTMPWLTAVGKGEERRAVVIPERADVVRRVFDLAIAGQGVSRIVRAPARRRCPRLRGGRGAVPRCVGSSPPAPFWGSTTPAS